MRYGPAYLFCGSRLTDDTLVLRAILEGLNTQARQWQETIVIQDNGSLVDLDLEVAQFKHLEHRSVTNWSDPNIVLCFMDRMSHNRASERLLAVAAKHKRPAFIIGSPEERITDDP